MAIYGVVLEKIFLNEPDIYYNKNKFDSGEINLCFITGHSGSGKSTMSKNMVNKDNIEHYELDHVVANKIYFSMNDLKEYGDLIYSFFKGPGNKYYYTKEDIDNNTAKPFQGNYDESLICDFIKYTISYSKSHKNKKIIIEGIWLFLYIKPEMLKDYAVYIKGTSRLISDLRAAKRDSEYEFPDDNIKRTKAYFNRLKRFFTKEALIDEKLIKNYRNYFSKLIKNEEE